jgi:hypothetical protein
MWSIYFQTILMNKILMFFHNMPYQYKFAEKTQDMLYYSMPCSSNKSFFSIFSNGRHLECLKGQNFKGGVGFSWILLMSFGWRTFNIYMMHVSTLMREWGRGRG